MATECLPCLLTARSGRIRVTEKSASILLDLLDEDRQLWLRKRRVHLELETAVPKDVRARLKVIDMTVDELERTQDEMGWWNDQPQ